MPLTYQQVFSIYNRQQSAVSETAMTRELKQKCIDNIHAVFAAPEKVDWKLNPSFDSFLYTDIPFGVFHLDNLMPNAFICDKIFPLVSGYESNYVRMYVEAQNVEMDYRHVYIRIKVYENEQGS